ncbi:trigger factor [Alteromonas phage vB_AemP_PT15-A5]|nr:trigger factor [Alteromonas phage vB_AemP_PT15-A5]
MSISFNLDAASIKAALISHVRDTLGIKTEGKELDFTFVTGRKTRNNPNPETSATITLSEQGEVVQQTVVEDEPTEEFVAESISVISEPAVEATEAVTEEVTETVAVEEEPSILPAEDDDGMFDD